MKTGKNKNYLLSYKEANSLCGKNGDRNRVFYENKYIIDGFNVSVFNYHLSQYSDFSDPFRNGRGNAYEMRGLTFIFNTDGTLFKRFLLLEKFFNLDQTEESLYHKIVDYTINSIQMKEDGSIISFVELPNGNIVAKSKMSFESMQAIRSNMLYNTNADVKKLVDWAIKNDFVAIFEYVAPTNRIVLSYTEEKLILLKIRNNKTGQHIYIDTIMDNIGDVEVAKYTEPMSLDTMISKCLVDEEYEGFVIHAINSDGYDFFYKIKTEWYRARHGILTQDIYRENFIIEQILKDNIDDIMGEIPDDLSDAKDRIDVITAVVRKEVAMIMSKIEDMYEIYLEIGNRKEFAIKYHKTHLFSESMSLVQNLETLDKLDISEYDSEEEYYNIKEKYTDSVDVYKIAIKSLFKYTNKLESARTWLSERCDLEFI